MHKLCSQKQIMIIHIIEATNIKTLYSYTYLHYKFYFCFMQWWIKQFAAYKQDIFHSFIFRENIVSLIIKIQVDRVQRNHCSELITLRIIPIFCNIILQVYVIFKFGEFAIYIL